MPQESLDGVPGERARLLLKALIERYIRDGQPVGSRTLLQDSRLDLSPATVRNVMADLEELGYITSPHTSAGRVPTDRGYRFFVDTLLKCRPVNRQETERLKRRIERDAQDARTLAASTSNLLSALTRLAGVVTVPQQKNAELRQIEFLALSEHRVLAILVINDREVQNRILELDRSYSQDELIQAANYLNAEFAGRTIFEVRQRLLEELEATSRRMNRMMLDAIAMAQQAFREDEHGPEYVLAGETNLMGLAGLADVDKLRRLFEGFNRKRHILHLLDKSLTANGVQIFIGGESGYRTLEECSVVTAPYTIDDEVVGVLGIIGPTRMAYHRVIPIVDLTAKLLGAALNSRS
ncbi:MAG: heat-inducible transcriptional repressor HrcA [Gammaproteobacteria bacterium]